MTTIQPVPKTTSARLEIIYKLKETLETGSPEVAMSVMIGGFTHCASLAQYVYLIRGFSLRSEVNLT